MNIDPVFLLFANYWRSESQKKDNEQLQEMKDNLQKEIEKHDNEIERFKLELEHPELFKQTSPKKYGQKIKRHKKRK